MVLGVYSLDFGATEVAEDTPANDMRGQAEGFARLWRNQPRSFSIRAPQEPDIPQSAPTATMATCTPLP